MVSTSGEWSATAKTVRRAKIEQLVAAMGAEEGRPGRDQPLPATTTAGREQEIFESLEPGAHTLRRTSGAGPISLHKIGIKGSAGRFDYAVSCTGEVQEYHLPASDRLHGSHNREITGLISVHATEPSRRKNGNQLHLDRQLHPAGSGRGCLIAGQGMRSACSLTTALL